MYGELTSGTRPTGRPALWYKDICKRDLKAGSLNPTDLEAATANHCHRQKDRFAGMIVFIHKQQGYTDEQRVHTPQLNTDTPPVTHSEQRQASRLSFGCILPDEQQTTRITGYTGGSVVLPCSCAHPQSTVNTFTWLFYGNGKQWIPVFEDEEYSGRRVLFNESSPQNLSLLISELRQEDQGFYECKTEHDKITITIRLTVKGCNLVQNTEVTIAVTGYAGESVVLPCSCSELLTKPEQIQWMYIVEKAYKEIYPNEKIERHKNRVKLLNQTSPGNLSLYISALTAEDEGDYYCSVSSQKVSYRLYVEGSFVLLMLL
ncbi:polymeric immunoglobulin receptor-like [Chanodichthys erythropterus]|uniref:polymeric immunoglobulin receptor-like n=1 Tax=Chanodichthys erythropterus TaxID=933992 RepID=UPI00351F2C71